MHNIPINVNQCPIITVSGHYYTRMQGILLAAGALQRPQAIGNDTGILLAKIIGSLPQEASVIIDCRNMSYVDHHAFEPLSRALIQRKSSILFLDTAAISSAIADGIKVPHRADIELPDFRVTYCGHKPSPSPATIQSLHSECAQQERNHVASAVKTSVEDMPLCRLASTPLKTTVAYNARKILASPPAFIWTVLLLADQLGKVLENLKSLKKPVVMAVSLRASPFAVIASILNSIECEIIDHMGPTPKILEEQLVIGSRTQEESIYLGDFCIGGTEMRIAQTYALLRGRAMRCAVVIGCVVTADGAFPGILVNSLVDLKTICPDAKYEL